MTWVRLDDGFHSHPKILRAGNGAAGLFARAMSFAGDQLTDGEIPDQWIAGACAGEECPSCGRDLGADERDALDDVGLWRRSDGGVLIPDWAEFNPTREQVKADRAAAAERQRRAREKRQKTAASR